MGWITKKSLQAKLREKVEKKKKIRCIKCMDCNNFNGLSNFPIVLTLSIDASALSSSPTITAYFHVSNLGITVSVYIYTHTAAQFTHKPECPSAHNICTMLNIRLNLVHI